MREFAAEQYLSGNDTAAAEQAAGRARLAAEQLSRDGTAIELIRAIFIPADETCIYIYRADSLEVVREAGARSSLRFERISEALTDIGLPRDVAGERA
ncbi:MAG: hypothetical protein ACLP50_00845 [Solirubrobacteraceae bacterium]